MPLPGCHIEGVQYRNVCIDCYDLGGCDLMGSSRARRDFCSPGDRSAVVFVFDCSEHDVGRIEEARRVLHQYMSEETLVGTPLLVLANKQDLPGAMSVDQVTECIHLRDLVEREWRVQPTVGIRGKGVKAGLKWLGVQLRRLRQ
ncbi:small GTPase superfamily, ARF type [Kipferlia bialata]|uniref:Small GTPase superfamily, ARF type n=1 Tax=Kipferlia bialata TaxID=797122 RepID=A0A9K3CY99_9EUKA|nr:small GTPase superfamily, ARF type [Kipferlia bialata]|eukprot:g7242.t1